jgi:limonene-1,2-epoxide hydrolase
MAARAFLTGVVVALALAGCGGGGGGGLTITGQSSAHQVPGNADPDDVAVIERWTAALDRGDVKGAAGYFALPSVAQNGLVFHIRTEEQARAFNASLPCGAEVIRAVSAGDLTTATFRLTERPGSGLCGSGTGGTAKTSFEINDGKIVQWRRVGGGSGAPRAPSATA